jgi:hypothetical protein
MTENDTQNPDRDSEILSRAMQIKADRGLSLTDAMLQAESEFLQPDAPQPFPSSFAVELHVKPRVARWIVQIFGGHETLTIEERLGAYLVTVLNRDRVKTIRLSEPPPDVGKGQAVSIRREHMPRVTE